MKYKLSQLTFRKDLIVTLANDKKTNEQYYLVKNPTSGETFELRLEEYFLCKSLETNSTTSEIITAFKNNFNQAIAEEDFETFIEQMIDCGLIEVVRPTEEQVNIIASPPLTNTVTSDVFEDEDEELEKKPQSDKQRYYKWSLFNPVRFFNFLASITKPFTSFFKLIVIALIPGFILALFIFIKNQSLVSLDIAAIPISFLVSLCFHLLTVNLLSHIVQGTVATSYGVEIKDLGLRLRFGVFPRFYINKREFLELNRNQKLWVYGAPLVFRIFLFVFGSVLWYSTRGTRTGLSFWSLIIAQTGLLSFLIVGLPIWGQGYKWFVTFFRLPHNIFYQALKVLYMTLARRPLPSSLSTRKSLFLLGFGSTISILYLYVGTVVVIHIASGLAKTFPNIFGKGTLAILIATSIVSALFWWKNQPKRENSIFDTINHPKPKSKKHFKFKNVAKLLVFIGCGILLFLPYPYSPGGQLRLLPPTQQPIQAQVDGKIIEVLFQGADGKWIKSKTVVANMEATNIQNNVLTLEQQVNSKQAEMAKQQDELNKLLATPRPEEVEVAKKQVEASQQEVEVAKKQLEIAQSRAKFSAAEVKRLEPLYKVGAFSLQQIENARKQAETDRITVEEMRQNVQTKLKDVEKLQANLALVSKGPYPQEIQAARNNVAVVQAEVNRLQQEVKYAKQQLQSTPLVMPIDGRITTPNLNQKLGTYIKQGETFAVVEDDRNMIGQVAVPEYDIGGFNIGRKVEIKLLAYPNEPLSGRVVSVEPTTSPEADAQELGAQIFKVNVEISNLNSKKIIKSGMTGYAKIDGGTQPLIVAFTRPLVRFIQVEIWSWLP